ncbi:response regulator [Methylobacterium brachiatum]
MIGRSLVRTLVDSGMTVEWVRDGRLGADAMSNGEHGLVLLDLGLPSRDGLDLLDEVSREGVARPLIVITARDDIDSRVLALDLGADDYLLKPFEGHGSSFFTRASLTKAKRPPFTRHI